ncbi:cupin domain-containing protein [Caldicellulosiruptor naganoensis]|uniref:Cupin domain-containing protein n=1 Tax=Caldicellulosiruptor naganoensis TaxID=29324 RepID=A0ABY7BFZ3_9FIRM|nr:cupin domain-containing protein [Caldicellulosiruptor naganoensis]WAM31333.1 cupin domain-containing protein [Caldicellulosiruptor naganoensis]
MPKRNINEQPSLFGDPGFSSWGIAYYKKGQKNIVERHTHDCDEYYFVLEGKIKVISEEREYILEKGDMLWTRMGDFHEIVEALEDTTMFWLEGPLMGKRRKGHQYEL